MFHNVKRLFSTIAFSFTVILGIQSAGAGELILSRETLQDPLIAPRLYQGTKRWESRSDGTFCEKFQNIELKWESLLEDVSLDFLEDGTMRVHFIFGHNKMNVNVDRKGGLLCSVTHTQGLVTIDQAHVQFRFFPAQGEETKPKFRIDDIHMEGLNIGSFEQEGPWGIRFEGNLPSDVAEWVSGNINSMMAWFLTTSVAERLTDYLSEKLIEKIGQGAAGPL
jgi:hypothetical protein